MVFIMPDGEVIRRWNEVVTEDQLNGSIDTLRQARPVHKQMA
jgi:hypothetical protein